MQGSKKRMIGGMITGGALLTVLAVVGVLASKGSTPAPQPFNLYSGGWGTSWTNNGYATNYAMAGMPMYVNLPLAVQMQPSGKYVPQLAKSWKIVGSQLQVMLQPGAKWQNGAPVTSQDVVNSYMLGATVGWPWPGVATGITAPNKQEVVFQLRKYIPGSTSPMSAQTALFSILQNYVFPSSVYGKFATAKLKSEVGTYVRTLPTKAGAAPSNANSSAHNFMIQAGQTLMAFNPSTLVGDGPFKLQGITTEQINLVRWPGYFGASKIHVPQIIAWNDASNNAATTQMFAGKMDYGWPGLTGGIVNRWKATANHHYSAIPTTAGEAFYFNNQSYPLSLVKVRQALAYLIDRRSLTFANNGFMKDIVNTYPTGLPHGLRTIYLGSTPAQMQKLGFNDYAQNAAKAKQILLSLHFTNRNGTWYTPKGKPFTISVITPAGWTGPQLAGSNLASQLNAFGIKTVASAVEQPGYWSQLLQGNFQMAWNWTGFFNAFPIPSLESSLVAQNYGVPNAAASSPTGATVGMGFGPKVNIPGIGYTNLAESLTAAGYVSDPAKVRQLVLDYAKLVNQYVPFLAYSTKSSETYWSSAHYTDWPPLSNKTLWDAAGSNPSGALLLMMMEGYVRPAE